MTIVKRHNSMFPTLLNDFFTRDWLDFNNSNFSTTNSTLPAVNIKESDDDYQIEVAAPGMKKEDIEIKFENDQLSISSENKEENKVEEGEYTRKEFSYQSFHRTFNVPQKEVDGEKISAIYNNGILSITLPKREEVKPKPAREIKIS